MGILLVLDVRVFVVPTLALLERLACPRGNGSLEGSTAIGGDGSPGGEGLLEGVDILLDGVELSGQLLYLDDATEFPSVEDDTLGGEVEGLVADLDVKSFELISEKHDTCILSVDETDDDVAPYLGEEQEALFALLVSLERATEDRSALIERLAVYSPCITINVLVAAPLQNGRSATRELSYKFCYLAHISLLHGSRESRLGEDPQCRT